MPANRVQLTQHHSKKYFDQIPDLNSDPDLAPDPDLDPDPDPDPEFAWSYQCQRNVLDVIQVGWYTLLTEIPTYLNNIQHISLTLVTPSKFWIRIRIWI